MAAENHSSGFELARFFVNEFHAFFGELKDKLDGIEGTVGFGNFTEKAKSAKKVKRTRAPSAFNLFVREELARTKEDASTAPEGVREGRMANASKKWSALTAEEKKAFAESKKDVLASGIKAAEDPEISPAREDPVATEALVASAFQQTAEKKKKKKKRDGDEEVGAVEATPGGAESGAERKKKKKKKSLALQPAA